ncbi:non-ribosomal peptide synthetase [Pedobacter paludis]|uniref:Non-ribosomal peptide synthetase n=1 Tax=Pedobacter paludis TaxID=2203212 RepID=A0A317F3K7_9SPHI|nr:non-ribosomal peptide synthetase [Pedobacter paludis]PWS33750.1 non-ribosomal peptide synthetase [Pedobacter paludis]
MQSFIPVDFDPFGEIKEIEKITLTNESQREIWLACVIGGNDANLSYNESVSLELNGHFDFDAFKKSVHDLILRHEALRSTISPNGESFIIYKNYPIDLELEDISTIDDQTEYLRNFVKKEMEIPLNLHEGPLFRVFIQKLNDTKHYFTLIIHHAIGDGWSIGIILEDLAKFYNLYIQGKKSNLEKPAQISDFAISQTKFQLSKEYQETEDFWLNQYKESVPLVDLPVDFERKSPRSHKGNRIDYPIDREFANKIKHAGAKVGSSLVTTLLTAFEVFIYSKTNSKDIVVGLPASGQQSSELYDLVGHCVNLLPIKSKIDPQKSFIDYLKQRKVEVLDAYDHQRLTFGELIKKLYIPRDSSRVTLVPIIFNIDMGMDQAVHFEGLDYKLISNPRAYENFELYLNITGSKEHFTLEWSYNTDLFKEETIRDFNNLYLDILRKIVSEPNFIIGDLKSNLLEDRYSEPNVNQTLKLDFNSDNSNRFSLKDFDLVKLMNQVAIDYADKTAISFHNTNLSFASLNEKSNRLANFLKQQNIGIGDIVAVSIDRSVEMLVSMVAIIKSGAAYLPLDPEYPVERIEFMLEDSVAKMLFVSKKHQGKLNTTTQEIVIENILENLEQYSETLVNDEFDGQSLAYILYTSGTTGKPKGTKITKLNLLNFLLSMKNKPGISESDKVLAITTICFDISGLELLLPLISGAEVVIADNEAVKDGRILLDMMEQKAITLMQATPSTWQMILDSGWDKPLPIKVLCGGEALSKQLSLRLLNNCSTLWNMYGPTETTIWSTIKQITQNDETVTIGRPINNTQIYILDQNKNRVGTNIEGEIFIGGLGVAQGYLNRDQLTSEKFINDPFSSQPSAKMYGTGDLGKLSQNGDFICLGRIDHQVKIRGYRVELGEIEACLTQESGVRQAVVNLQEDKNGDKKLIAYLTVNALNSLKKETVSWLERWNIMYDAGISSTAKEEIASESSITKSILKQITNSNEYDAHSEEWITESINRIKEIGAKRIVEIGCGDGQLITELSPSTELYIATDYSPVAIDYINKKIEANPNKWKNVSALVAEANDFSQIAKVSPDLVLINSVVQYFSSSNYLLDVIEKAAATITSGCIFIGDVQGKKTLKMHHAGDQFLHSPDDLIIGDFEERVKRRIDIEDELMIDPDFFYLIKKELPKISHVEIQLRKGKYLNETTKYHYDVWLYINSDIEVIRPQETIEWANLYDFSEFEQKLVTLPLRSIFLKNIPNLRLRHDYQLLEQLKTLNASNTVGDLRKTLENKEIEGFEPGIFWELGEKLGYQTHVRWSNDGTDGNFEVVFVPNTNKTIGTPMPSKLLAVDSKVQEYEDSVTILGTSDNSEMIRTWKKNLASTLPEYMVPSELVILNKIPLSNAGKVNRKELPYINFSSVDNKSVFVEPRTPSEKIISQIWKDILNLGNISIKSDFFELGGHSLLAVKVMIAIEKETQRRLPLATLFENSTIEKLAKMIDIDEKEIKWDSLVAIKKTGKKPPIYLVHGGGLNVLVFSSLGKYMDNDQPVYGMQALGLDGKTEFRYSIEELAERYNSEIINNDPVGPYAIAGYSYGGLIAYEMARKLQEMGKEVKMLGILDTNAAGRDFENTKLQKIVKKLFRQFSKLIFFSKSFIVNPQEVYLYQKKSIKYKLKALIGSKPQTKKEEYDFKEEIVKSYEIAYQNYFMKPLDIKVDLFRVKKRIYFLDDPVFLGWKDYALKGVNIHEVPGDHKTFLFPPNDKDFAEILQKTLDSK